jgi:hypothetical protein
MARASHARIGGIGEAFLADIDRYLLSMSEMEMPLPI